MEGMKTRTKDLTYKKEYRYMADNERLLIALQNVNDTMALLRAANVVLTKYLDLVEKVRALPCPRHNDLPEDGEECYCCRCYPAAAPACDCIRKEVL